MVQYLKIWPSGVFVTFIFLTNVYNAYTMMPKLISRIEKEETTTIEDR